MAGRQRSWRGGARGLRPGADDDAIAKAEAACGAPFPPTLRALYAWHDGQQDREGDWFFGTLVFCDLEYARLLREGFLYAYLGVRGPGQIARDEIFFADGAGPRDEELDGRWFPFANEGGDFLAVHLGTGRVCKALKGEFPPCAIIAESLPAFVASYAENLERVVIALR